MPRVLVVTEDHNQVLFDEEVQPTHLDSKHSNVQLLERLMWGIEDAARAEAAFMDAVSPKDYREVAAS